MVTIWHRAAVALAAVFMTTACGAATDLVESDPTDPTDATPTGPTASTSPTDPTTPTEPSQTTPTTPAVAEPKVGECRRTNPLLSALGGSLEVRQPVPCGDTHNAQTYFVGLMNEEAQAAARNSNGEQLRSMVAGICGRKLTAWLGGSGEDVALSVFDFVVGAPGPEEIGPGVRWFSCDAYAIRAMNGLKLTALPRTTQDILSSSRADAWSQCNRGGFGDGTTNIVVCSRAHSYRAVAGIHLDDLNASYPGSNNLQSRLESDCTSRVRAYLNTTAGFNYGVTWPSRRQWNSGDRWGICYAQTSS
jgi:Septum formation